MARRMLIDATHPEETRVVVLNGTKLEEFDFETSTKKQIKGNIYLAKIIRVEPSLQAAFVEYGGNRHGFLAFSEIHSDYYRIPVSDREAMLAAERQAHDQDDDDSGNDFHGFPDVVEEPTEEPAGFEDTADRDTGTAHAAAQAEPEPVVYETAEPLGDGEAPAETEHGDDALDEHDHEPPVPLETVGGDELEEVAARPRVRHYRNYKIQEVIKRRQIILVQVTKEERGNKGAALTTYLSLAGRYCVLMPNAGRGGGVSRKITSAADRRRLKELMEELEVPDGMGVIVRTAGSERSKAEIKRDYEYLLRLWDDIRELTLRSSAPALIYEEGNLIKRAIRDLYARDIEEILVEGEVGYSTAKEFMRMLMPSHTSRVRAYRDPAVPLYHRFQVDAQIDQIHNPVVQLRSGGYIVINPTEALVSIDVNSGRATRERNIEETATKTNLEAADEIGRQLRLRDLAGLVVIDFIDMEDNRNQRSVEARVKDAMKLDRARIQLGRISAFGLLELSRQRLRSSLIEASTQPCPHCNGTGTIRSTESAALVVLRALEEEGIRRRTAEVTVAVPTQIALYVLNQKRETLTGIEHRYGFSVTVGQDDSLIQPAYRLDRMRAMTPAEFAALPAPAVVPVEEPEEDYVEPEEVAVAAEAPVDAVAAVAEIAGEAPRGSEEERRRKRRRRKRRHPGDRDANGAVGTTEGDEIAEGEAASDEIDGEAEAPVAEPEAGETVAAPEGEAADATDEESAEHKRRRRGKRGGRRRRREDGEPVAEASDATDVPEQAAPDQDALEYDDGYLSPLDFARDGRPAVAAERVELVTPPAPETEETVIAEVMAAFEETPAPVGDELNATESAPEPPAEAAAVVEPPPVVVEEAVEAPPVLAEAVETPAKKKRAPRRKAAPAIETPAIEAEAVDPAPVAPPEEPAPAKKPAAKRSRARKTALAVEVAPAEPEAPVQADPVVDGAAEIAEAVASVVDAVIEAAAPVEETAPIEPAAPVEEAVRRPRKSGWWNRGGQEE